MPELPEVTVITEQLNEKLKGLVLKSIEYDWPKKFYWGDFSIKDISGARITGVERRGKLVIIYLDNNILILFHLKLTGQLIFVGKNTRVGGGHPLPPLNSPVPNTTTRVAFTFSNGEKLYFNDMRKFGWVKIIPESKLGSEPYIKNLGPDPLEISFTEFKNRLNKRPQGRIKKTLMDQSVVGGIGNIYSDEGLWYAKVDPKRSVVSLDTDDLKAIYNGVRKSFKIAIEKGGSSDNAYVDSGGEKGLYLSFRKTYHMTGKPCSRCKTPIVREKIDGRSAHYCPNCQKIK